MKLIHKIKIKNETEIQILGIPVLSFGTKETSSGFEKYINTFPKSKETQTLKHIIKQIPKEHDGIFLMRAGLGEAYLFCYLYSELKEKYKLKNPCVVCHRPIYKDLISLFHPQLPFYHIEIDKGSAFSALIHKNNKYHKVFININPSPLWQLQNLLKKYETQNYPKHYAEAILDFNDAKKFNYTQPIITKQIKEQALEKVKGLNLKKFVFIVPSANFVINLENSFWQNFFKKLQTLGYDIFQNTPNLTIAEAFYIASLSKAIIGLRCGFVEILSSLTVPKHIIYTPCKHINWTDIQEKLTLKKYPFVDEKTILEYDSTKTSLDKIENKILGALK